jgi:Prokaryotic membrane lipoprotein lipid attachment site
MRLPILLAVAAFALAGCNANQTPNAAAQTALGAGSADNFNPINYAQTTGFYAGH